MARPLPNSSEKAGRKDRRRPKRPRTLAPGQDVAERSRIWQALLESEDRYRATFDCAPVGIMHSSVDSNRILHANPKLSEMLGYTEIELLGMTTDDILHPDHAGADRPRYREKMLSGELGSFSSERKYVRKNSSVVWVNRTVSLVRDPVGKPLYFIRIMEDITERKQAEANLERLMRARRVMAECNRVLVHATDENAMLLELCRVVVDSGGYKMAWIGFASGDPARPVRAAAHAGFDGDSPMSGSVAWSADGRYQGFMHEVIATGNPHISRNILEEFAHSRRRARAEQRGFQSSIALPLRKEGRILGAIAIYASEPDAFDADEITLLTGLADDIGFGINSMRERLARLHAEAERRESELRLSLALEGSGQALFDWNIVTGELFLSPRWNELIGGDRAPMRTTVDELARLVHPDDRDHLKASIIESLKGDTLYRADHRVRNRAGDWIWIQSHGKVTARDEQGRALRLAGYNTDITPRKLAELALAESEERFRATFEQAAVGIGHVGFNGTYIRVNRKFREITGYTEQELTGSPSVVVSHPDDIGSGDRARKQLLAGEIDSYANDKRYLRQDGTTIWVNRTESLARDAAGKPLYFIRVIEDITRRKAAEDERTRLSKIVENASDAIIGCALDGTITSWNAASERMFGYATSEMIGQPITLLMPEQHRQLTDNNEELQRGEIIPANERTRVTKDGRTIHVQSGISPIRNDAGEVVGAAVIVRDISERKSAEEAVIHERVLLRTIIDTVPDYIYVKDAQGRFLLANRSWLSVRGSADKAIAGKTVFDFFPRDIGEKMAAQDADIVRTGVAMPEREQRIILNTPDWKQDESESRWAAITKVPMRDPSGRIIGTVGVSRDITERKRAEEALRTSEERFRATFDSAPVGIMHTGIADDRILQANPKLSEMLGYTRDELLLMCIDDIVHPDQRGTDRRTYREKMLSGKLDSFSSERKYLRKDGSILWVNRIVSLAKDAAGKPLYFNRIIEDITERIMSAHRRAMEHAVTQALAQSATVEGAMQLVLQTICHALEWTCGAYWKWNESDELLRCTETWHMDAAGIAEFVAASIERPNEAPAWHGAPPGTNVGGIVRRVWFSGAPVWFPDVMRQPDFRRGMIAAKAGLHSAFGFPILSGAQPLGVMEFYSREIRQPNEALLQIVQAIGSQIGQFIQRKEAERALRTSEERYRDVFDASPLPMWVSDDETLDIVAVNQAAVEHYGYSRDEFLRMNVRDMWAPGEASDYEQNIRSRSQQQALHLQRRHRTKDGHIIDTEVTARLFTLDGRAAWLTLANDVSVRIRAEAALRESEEQFRQLSGNIPQVFWITDTTHRQTLFVSPAAEVMLGRPLQDILADRRALVRAVHKEDRARVYAARRAAVESGYDETYRILRADGSLRWVHDRAFPVRDGEGRIYRIAGIAEDVTDRKHAEERLEHLAHYDMLTNLPNRALFYDRLKQALAQAKRNRWTMGVMFIDADRFKNVNDTLGHAVGDKLLQQIAERLTRSVRSDDTVGRLGGDEFAIVLSTLASAQDATLVAQKIMTSFNNPFKLEGTEVYVTASIGITLYPDDSTDHDVLIKNADTAMYRAKEIGRNGYQFYTPEMNARAIELLGMESSLRRALERKEFLLHYQPKASVADGDITGLEALLRWKHPERGLVSPAEFIPLLEESGLIVPVGEWVLKAVCLQIKAWERAGNRPVPVSVNLSARQFAAKDLGPTIKRILEEHQVDPALIECEITESSLMENTEEAVRTLEYLDQLGVGLSIDDFGTGYSSLGYLKRFPLSALKIDRSFVRDVTTDGDDATITRAIISMAHNLGLKVIGEGVETRAQLEFLAEYGCNEIQGFYFARPLAAEECGTWIREDRRLERPGRASDVSVPVVLVLDDDDDTLAHVERTLARDGYRILAARNAREGFALLRDNRVDVVVSDQNMPGMSGVEFLQRVQTLSPKTMRILATGHADFQTMTDAVNKGGIFRCLPKDIDDDALRQNVREAVQARIRAQENTIPPGALRK